MNEAYKKIAITDKSIQHLIKHDKRLAKVITTVGEIECRTHDDPYAFIVMEIVGQMLSNKVAAVISTRLRELCTGTIVPEVIGTLTLEDLRSIGLSMAKCEYIKAFTDAVLNESIDFNEFANLPDGEVIRRLTAIRGIGKWTAKMYLIFVLQREDVLPIEDGAFMQGYKWLYKTQDVLPQTVSKKCRKWKPYSSIAARYLYRAVDLGLIKTEFHLYK